MKKKLKSNTKQPDMNICWKTLHVKFKDQLT